MQHAQCAVIREDADLGCLNLRTLTGPKLTWMVPWHQLGKEMNMREFVESKLRVQPLFECSRGLTRVANSQTVFKSALPFV
jgi:hypothetical protein